MKSVGLTLLLICVVINTVIGGSIVKNLEKRVALDKVYVLLFVIARVLVYCGTVYVFLFVIVHELFYCDKS